MKINEELSELIKQLSLNDSLLCILSKSKKNFSLKKELFSVSHHIYVGYGSYQNSLEWNQPGNPIQV